MTRKQLLIGLVALAVIALGVVAYFIFSGGGQDTTVPDSGGKLAITLKPSDRTLGNPKAPILMVEYAAPSCPHCSRWDAEVFPLLKKNYIDTGKVYYVFRVFPLRPADVAVESMARCLPADSYFQFIELMFRNQEKWDPEYGISDTHAALVEMGRIAGMSAEQVDTCIGNQAEEKRASDVGQEAATKYGISGTPSFIINGQLRSGEFPWDQMKTLLDSMLPKK
ncbi:MAG TPA: DsbA family protein [Rhizomicrobium sp.]|nr:DsbA family protein [Rhizomicrobium sp.]